ncbi:MAG: hypothetical protein CMP49_05295 [Flavobacteriales bacterium]|nr:hypothetical protein [Flavobacteriales bacterium]|tara:strand:- start:31761 stop:32882 length:1122 start_codon:yes stop_codon:yes gene_type:complete
MEFQLQNISYKGLLFLGLLIIILTLLYTNNLASQFKIEEQKKVALWAKATKELSDINNSNFDLGFVFEVVNNNTTVPVIQIDENGEIKAHRNVKNPEKELLLMMKKYPPIELELIDGSKEYIYYKDSKILQQLKYFPFFIFLVIIAFMLIAYSAFSNARVAQQNKVWIGMAKETAHQIGTPLSSLMGWLEYLKKKSIDKNTLIDIEKDLDRLKIIASRFSKIGSLPKLENRDINIVLEKSVYYMKKRVSKKISLKLNTKKQETKVLINVDLFEWVVENIIKNSVDAIDEKGKISIDVNENKNYIVIDFTDNGKGIKKAMFKEIFKPGFTSKKRGWGLGLSLVKRIIEEYHKGEVSIYKSIPNKETIIRILLIK